jgi:hypothetical protein
VRRSDNRYLLIAVFALCAGLVTLGAGHRPEIAIVELVLIINGMFVVADEIQGHGGISVRCSHHQGRPAASC